MVGKLIEELQDDFLESNLRLASPGRLITMQAVGVSCLLGIQSKLEETPMLLAAFTDEIAMLEKRIAEISDELTRRFTITATS